MKTYNGVYFETGNKNHNGVSDRCETEAQAIAKCIEGWAFQRDMGYTNFDQCIFMNTWSRVFDDNDILLADNHSIAFVKELKVDDYEEQIQALIDKRDEMLK